MKPALTLALKIARRVTAVIFHVGKKKILYINCTRSNETLKVAANNGTKSTLEMTVSSKNCCTLEVSELVRRNQLISFIKRRQKQIVNMSLLTNYPSQKIKANIFRQ